MAGNPTVSIVVPVRNGGAAFQRCLAAIAGCAPAPLELIVVDDDSSDDSATAAEAAGARCLRLPRQRGPAYARNRGAQTAAGEILFFVDADVEVRRDAVAQVLSVFAAEPQLAATFGSYDDAPAAPSFLSQYKNLMHHYVHQMARAEAETFWAGCGAIRREVFVAAGGFDESYERPSIEDIELGTRLRQAGHEIRLCKSLQAKHLKRWTVTSLLRADIRDRALPWASLMLRQGRLANDLNLGWSSRIASAAVGMLVVMLVLAWRWPWLWLVALALALLLLALNAPLYAFFRRKGGWLFAGGCVAWHWLYLFYSGVSFVLVFALHRLGFDGRQGARA